jgi:predicted transcriptional regulator
MRRSPSSPDLTTAELRVMKALWEVEQGTVAEVRSELGRRGQDLAYTTVMTLLGRLGRELVLRDRLREFVKEVFDGQADSLVLNLVEDERLSRAELRAIEKTIADAERKGDKK